MRLKRIRLHNFLPFRDEDITFSSDGSRPLTIVWGDNEHGKTTLLNAVRWALYGYAIGRNRREYPLAKMVNRDARSAGNWSMKVVLEFESDGADYVLARSISKRDLVATPSGDDDFEMTVRMTDGGEPLAQDRINEVIGRTLPKAISRFHLFDGELLQEYEELVGAETSQVREIRTAIEDILGTPALLIARDELKPLVKEAMTQQAEAMRKAGASSDAATQLLETQRKIERAQEDLNRLVEEEKSAEDDIAGIQDKLTAMARELDRQDEIDSLTQQLDALNSERQELRVEKGMRLRTLWRDTLHPLVADRVKELESSVSEREDALIELGSSRTELANLERLLEDERCGVCESTPVRIPSDEQVGILRGRIEDLEAVRAHGQADLGKLSVLAKIQPTGDLAAIEKLERRAAQKSVEARKTDSKINELKESVVEESGREAQRLRKREGDLNRHLGSLGEKKETVLQRLDELQDLETELSRIMAGSDDAEAKRANLVARAYSELQDVMKKAIDTHRLRLVREVGLEASKRFMSLTATPEYKGLQINSNYGLSILDHENRPVDLRSSGAEQVVALSLIQALGALSQSDAPLIIDTPFGRLDLKHRSNILRALPGFGGQVILLAHEGELDPVMARAEAGHAVAEEYEIRQESPSHSVIRKRTS